MLMFSPVELPASRNAAVLLVASADAGKGEKGVRRLPVCQPLLRIFEVVA
jgi:hypothetical protein